MRPTIRVVINIRMVCVKFMSLAPCLKFKWKVMASFLYFSLSRLIMLNFDCIKFVSVPIQLFEATDFSFFRHLQRWLHLTSPE